MECLKYLREQGCPWDPEYIIEHEDVRRPKCLFWTEKDYEAFEACLKYVKESPQGCTTKWICCTRPCGGSVVGVGGTSTIYPDS